MAKKKVQYNHKTRTGWIGDQLCTKEFNITPMAYQNDLFEIQIAKNRVHLYLSESQIKALVNALDEFARHELGGRR